jgi:hypothetical protein
MSLPATLSLPDDESDDRINDDLPIAYPDLQRQYEQFNEDELFAEIRRRASLTAENLLHLAILVVMAEKRGYGERLQQMRWTLLPYLRRIAYGQVRPQLVADFAGSSGVLRKLTALPLPEQDRVLKGGIPVVFREGGQTQKRTVPVAKMSYQEINQVFATDHIRDEGEQLSYLTSRPAPIEVKATAGYLIDRKRRGIVVSGVFISRKEMQAALKELDKS